MRQHTSPHRGWWPSIRPPMDTLRASQDPCRDDTSSRMRSSLALFPWQAVQSVAPGGPGPSVCHRLPLQCAVMDAPAGHAPRLPFVRARGPDRGLETCPAPATPDPAPVRGRRPSSSRRAAAGLRGPCAPVSLDEAGTRSAPPGARHRAADRIGRRAALPPLDYIGRTSSTRSRAKRGPPGLVRGEPRQPDRAPAPGPARPVGKVGRGSRRTTTRCAAGTRRGRTTAPAVASALEIAPPRRSGTSRLAPTRLRVP